MPHNRAFTLISTLAIALAARGGCAIFAETTPSSEVYLSLAESLDAKGIDSIESGTVAGVRFSLDSARGEALKGSARVSLGSSAGLTLDRAYLKARFLRPTGGSSLRLTLGKAPLSWGKGFFFNAGDPIFGAAPSLTALSPDEYRTETAWMAGAYVPFGDFSFAEAVALPRVGTGNVAQGAGNDENAERTVTRAVAGSENPDTRAGCRVIVTPGWDALQSAEVGFLSSDDGPLSAYASFDGSLAIDWYGALSARWDTAGANPGAPELAISFGLFRIFSIVPGKLLTARAETLVYPAENRELWYPELTLSLTEDFSVFARGLLATGRSVARIAEDAASGDAAGNATGALGALPWLDSGDALALVGFTWDLLNDITLSGNAFWRPGKGDVGPIGHGLTVQAGFTCAF
jgi:hypothetical protein